jgi:hypothetical protein
MEACAERSEHCCQKLRWFPVSSIEDVTLDARSIVCGYGNFAVPLWPDMARYAEKRGAESRHSRFRRASPAVKIRDTQERAARHPDATRLKTMRAGSSHAFRIVRAAERQHRPLM